MYNEGASNVLRFYDRHSARPDWADRVAVELERPANLKQQLEVCHPLKLISPRNDLALRVLELLLHLFKKEGRSS